MQVQVINGVERWVVEVENMLPVIPKVVSHHLLSQLVHSLEHGNVLCLQDTHILHVPFGDHLAHTHSWSPP